MSVRQKEKYVHRPTPCGIPLTQLSVDYSNTKTKEYANIRIYRSLYDIEKHATRKQNKKKTVSNTHTHTRTFGNCSEGEYHNNRRDKQQLSDALTHIEQKTERESTDP